jgi:hypothetical protein
MGIDVGSAFNTFSSGSQSAGSAGNQVLGAIGSVGRIAGALNNLSNPAEIISKLRSANLPIGGNAASLVKSAGAQWNSADAEKDWRVRLSLPTDSNFTSSPILQPLKEAGGMIFPYTPQIQIASSASYSEDALTHQNYASISYTNSKSSEISMDAPFYVEDAVQAQYWLAAVHYFRSVTKMYTGDSGTISGNPPPIVLLNGYGDYVFKNIPVVVKSFSVSLSSDTNYISTTVGQSQTSNGFGGFSGLSKPNSASLGARTSILAGVAGAIGGAKAAQIVGMGVLAAGAYNAIQNAKNSNGVTTAPGGFGVGGASHVPVKSSFNITLLPIYSRESMRKFNLNTFINGGYIGNKVGYL